MTEFMARGTPTSPHDSSCEQTPVVEALFDGRLGAREKASVERHVATCAACAAHRASLDAIRAHVRGADARVDMRAAEVAPLAHQRARSALLRSAVNPEAKASTSTNGWLRARVMPFAVAAAVVAIALIVGFSWGRSTSPRAPIASATVASPALSHAAVDPESGARFERARSGEADEVKLTAGTLRVRSASRGGEPLVVRVGAAVLQPKESVFRVTAVDGALQSVVVEEGSVELEVAGYYAEIPAGGSWRSSAITAAVTPSAPPTSSPPVAVTTPSSSSTSATSAPPTSTSIASLPSTPAPTPTIAVASTATPKTTPNGFSAAMRSIDAGDYDAAAREMSDFSTTHPNDPRSDEADYMRAIALERAGRVDEAKAAAHAYLAKWPSGAHRAEAASIANR